MITPNKQAPYFHNGPLENEGGGRVVKQNGVSKGYKDREKAYCK